MSRLDELHIDEQRFSTLIELAVAEDLGARGDISTQLCGMNTQSRAQLLVRDSGVSAGLALVPVILRHFDEGLIFTPQAEDGAQLSAGEALGTIEGPTAAILTAERTVLNFLQRLSGIATLTARYVEAVAGTDAEIFDTRKTTPGWRDLEKYAVRTGGGHNHRRGLHDAILLKDNHLAGLDPERLDYHIFELLNVVGELKPPPEFIEVEVDTLAQFEQLLKVVGIDVIMLDNFSIADLTAAVSTREVLAGSKKVILEASGGVNLDTVGTIAHTGVDRISVGALTHSACALDIALELAKI